MKINEVMLFELYFDDLKGAILDRLAQALGKNVNEISTEKFRKALASDGFLLSVDELVNSLNDMGVVQSADENSIVPKGKIANDTAEPEEPEVDVAQMAGDQAISAVKDEIPQ